MTQFYLVRQHSERHPNLLHKAFHIEAFCGSHGIMTIHLSLSLNKYDALVNLHEFSLSLSQFASEAENNSFLVGYFGLPLSGGLEQARSDLLKRINNPQDMPSHFSEKWTEFSRGFAQWFKTKVKPEIFKERDLYAQAFLR